MRVSIGKYVSWNTPEDLLIKWVEPIIGHEKYDELEDFLEPLMDKLRPITRWVYEKQSRRIKVKIDPWDTWNMDGTLGLIILPMLIQLQKDKHGSPIVDDDDVPNYLRTTFNDFGESDVNIHERWEYIMNEMIWTFTNNNMEGADEFINEDDRFYSDVEIEGWNKLGSNMNMKPTWHDIEGAKAHHLRKANGFRLFGKYYQGLWD
tara:strand:- start:826 stop:1440 length:615 start_codon:yes stop_codon:yes gene_type:complete